LKKIEITGGGGGSRTIQRIDSTQVIDSSYGQRGKKGTIADSIVRLLYENLFAFRLVKSLPQAQYPTVFASLEDGHQRSSRPPGAFST
jgi:hypothetical protein